MGRSGKRIGRDIVIGMAKRVRQEEHQRGEENQRKSNGPAIFRGIIRVERNRILWSLHVNTGRVV